MTRPGTGVTVPRRLALARSASVCHTPSGNDVEAQIPCTECMLLLKCICRCQCGSHGHGPDRAGPGTPSRTGNTTGRRLQVTYLPDCYRGDRLGRGTAESIASQSRSESRAPGASSGLRRAAGTTTPVGAAASWRTGDVNAASALGKGMTVSRASQSKASRLGRTGEDPPRPPPSAASRVERRSVKIEHS